MKKVLKILGRIFLGFIALIIAFLLILCVINAIMMSKEKKYFEEPLVGQFVEVDGHKMNVYVAGEGEHTLVFLAGSGATCPAIFDQPFAERFTKDYRIVIIEKFGYGFSDAFDGSRDIETRVDQNRKALQAAGVEGPYVLCPHSYSGLEAIYWAQNHSDEVEAIIGLDMAVPRAYDKYDDTTIKQVRKANTLKRALNHLGVVRLVAGGSLTGEFTEEEKKVLMAVLCRGYGNKTASREVEYVRSDVELIDGQAVPDVPTLMIISDGKITDGWIGFAMDYASELSDVTTLQLDCGHSVYEYEPEKCEEAMRTFLKNF